MEILEQIRYRDNLINKVNQMKQEIKDYEDSIKVLNRDITEYNEGLQGKLFDNNP